ncbi:MAG: toxin-antitoxin system HicB family antitoxin [Pseudomonadota bacterium]
MSTLSLRIPDSTHSRLKAWAQQDNVSINQFISTAVAEKLAALATLEYVEARAKKGDKARFEAALALVPHGDMPPQDSLK